MNILSTLGSMGSDPGAIHGASHALSKAALNMLVRLVILLQ